MAGEDKDFVGEIVDQYLRFLRGRGPRPDLDAVPAERRREVEELLALVEAVTDADEVARPPLKEDPVAVRLGLVPGPPEGGSASGEEVPPREGDADDIDAALAEVAQRFRGEVEIGADHGNGSGRFQTHGFLPARAVCRTLGEVVMVCTTDESDFSELAERVAPVFMARPMATAVAVVSNDSLLAAVFTQADCVRAIDPIRGWVDPSPSVAPEPIGIALGRHLERSLPHWDEVARLDEMLLLTEAGADVERCVGAAMQDTLSRQARITAKRAALESLQGLAAAAIEGLVDEVRTGRLAGDDLIDRLRDLSRVNRA